MMPEDAPGHPVPMYAVYAGGPDPMEANQIIRRMKCASEGCDRLNCTSSAVGYGYYCCPECYRGQPHRENCNIQDVFQRARLVHGVPPIDSQVYFEHLRAEIDRRGSTQLCPTCCGLGVLYGSR